MILVNHPGSWNHLYAPLRHAAWHGYTFADFIFPSFVFVLGASAALSAPTAGRILQRSVLLLLAGLFIQAFPFLHLDGSLHGKLVELRLPGVLQRLAIVYFFVAFSGRYLNFSWIGCLVFINLLTYDLILRFGAVALSVAGLPINGCSGWAAPEQNLAACLDRWLFGRHMYLPGRYDPEGLLSTWPAVATGWIGYLAAGLYRENSLPWWSFLLLLLGAIAWPIPLNKILWTPSYVLLSAALSIMLLLLFARLDRGQEGIPGARLADPVIAAGRNALLVFVGSAILARSFELVGLRTQIFSWLCLFFEPVAASLFYATVWTAAWLSILVFLDLRKIYLRL